MEKFIEEPRFLEITPTTIRRSQFHVIEEGDIENKNDMQLLVQLMYEHPERSFYIFCQKDRGMNSVVLAAYHTGFIQFLEEEFSYFRHPHFAHDYVRILEENIHFSWERDVFERGPMYVRTKLALTKRCERDLEQTQLIVRQQDTNPLIMQPTFFGIGVDLRKLLKWVNTRLRTKKI